MIAGEPMVADTIHISVNGQTQEQRGKAFFDLCIFYAMGRNTSSATIKEAMNWIASSALLGYPDALIVGKRVHQANNLTVPNILNTDAFHGTLHDQLILLESFPGNQVYCNAIRMFWPEALRTSTQHCLRTYIVDEDVSLDKFIQTKINDLDSSSFHELAEKRLLVHQAVMVQSAKALQLLLCAKVNINLRTPDGRTALHLACQSAHVPIIRLLLAYGADASINGLDNVSPLHWLVLLPTDELHEVACDLIAQGAELNTLMKKENTVFYDCLGLSLKGTPLDWSCMCRNHVAVTSLLSLGADPLLSPIVGSRYGPIEMALSSVCSDILDLLFSETNVLELIPLDRKVRFYDYIGQSFWSNDLQRWYMHGARYEEVYLETMDTLARYIPFPNDPATYPEFRPLKSAIMYFNVPLIKAMIRHGADLNEPPRGCSALMKFALDCCLCRVAGLSKMMDMIQFLVENGASLDGNHACEPGLSSPPPLFTACDGVPAEIVTYLAVSAPHQINKKYDGQTPLHRAAQGLSNDARHAQICRALLDLGADPNIECDHFRRDRYVINCCYTATAWALNAGDWLLVTKPLLDQGASSDIGIGGDHRETLAHLLVRRAASKQGLRLDGEDKLMANLLENLLQHPVAKERDLLNDQGYHGIAPLGLATFYGLPYLVEVLLKFGATMENVASPGMTLAEMIRDCRIFQPRYVVESVESPTDLDRRDRRRVNIERENYCSLSDYDSNLERIDAMQYGTVAPLSLMDKLSLQEDSCLVHSRRIARLRKLPASVSGDPKPSLLRKSFSDSTMLFNGVKHQSMTRSLSTECLGDGRYEGSVIFN